MNVLSFYKFLPLSNLPALKADLLALSRARGLRGTILLSHEGINGMMSGEAASLLALKEFLRPMQIENFKEHDAADHAFHRLLVKIKKEIISVGDPDLKPHESTGRRVSALELKAWLDEGREIELLDTRNAYEVEVGTFRGARDFKIDSSRDFTARAAAATPELKNKTVVTFCTGGIRCEKASAALEKLGWEDVYQLDGGILDYFKQVGDAHFAGPCFVFDWRLAVNGKLEPVERAEFEKQYGRHLQKR